LTLLILLIMINPIVTCSIGKLMLKLTRFRVQHFKAQNLDQLAKVILRNVYRVAILEA